MEIGFVFFVIFVSLRFLVFSALIAIFEDDCTLLYFVDIFFFIFVGHSFIFASFESFVISWTF